MNGIEQRRRGQLTKSWWSAMSPLEKMGTVALGIVGATVVAVVLLPHAAAVAAGGALTATGGLLLKKGFGK